MYILDLIFRGSPWKTPLGDLVVKYEFIILLSLSVSVCRISVLPSSVVYRCLAYIVLDKYNVSKILHEYKMEVAT